MNQHILYLIKYNELKKSRESSNGIFLLGLNQILKCMNLDVSWKYF